jgi:hypothetical protein
MKTKSLFISKTEIQTTEVKDPIEITMSSNSILGTSAKKSSDGTFILVLESVNATLHGSKKTNKHFPSSTVISLDVRRTNMLYVFVDTKTFVLYLSNG